MYIIYCADPLSPRQPDSAYEAEAAAAAALSIPFHLVHFEALVNDGDPLKAVRFVTEQLDPVEAIYRGWMLKPNAYARLYDALKARGIHLINTPDMYRHTHYLPESYPTIEGHTPRSVWLSYSADTTLDEIMAHLTVFGDSPLILKDYVKSQKHYWHEACFIPHASDRDAVGRVVDRFLELQGDDLNEGLVFRAFVEFEPLTQHPRSGMPLTREYRIFFLDGVPLLWAEYWDEGDYGNAPPPLDQFASIARQVHSRFFTMDIARRRDGDWMILELGDGQVAGLLDTVLPTDFYRVLIDTKL